MTTDIRLRRDDSLFRYRVAAVCLERGRILLQQIKGKDYWFLPGGHGRLMEASADSLQRELREELEAEIGRLLWVVESFFKLDGVDFHEVGLYYLVKLMPGATILGQEEMNGLDDDVPVRNRWHVLDDLGTIRIVPEFLADRLRHLPSATEAIVHRDRGQRPAEREQRPGP